MLNVVSDDTEVSDERLSAEKTEILPAAIDGLPSGIVGSEGSSADAGETY